MNGKYRQHGKYPNIKFGIFKATDRDSSIYQGYIRDNDLKGVAPKRWSTSETVERDAWRKVNEMIDEIYSNGNTIASTKKEITSLTIKSVLESYLEMYFEDKVRYSGKPEHHQKQLMQNRKTKTTHLIKNLGDLSPHSLNADVIDSYIHKRLSESVEGTVKGEVELLRTALLKVLRDKGVLILHKLKGHKILHNAKERETIINKDHFECIVKNLPDWMKLPIRLTHFTGCRQSEVRELIWDNIDFENNCLNFFDWQVKEGRERKVYLDAEFEFITALSMMKTKAPKNEHGACVSQYVFLLNDDRVKNDIYYYHWNQAQVDCNLIDATKKLKSGKPVVKYKLHDLRRTRISALQANGASLKLIQKQVGHSATAMTMRYTQVEDDAQAEMAGQINKIDSELAEKRRVRLEAMVQKKERLKQMLANKDVWTTEDKDEFSTLLDSM